MTNRFFFNSFLLLLILFFAGTVIQVFMTYASFFSEWAWAVTCIIAIIQILYFFKKSIPVVIMLSFFLPYLFIPKFFFVYGSLISYHFDYQSPVIFNKVAILNSIFLIFLFIGIGRLQTRNTALNLVSILQSKYLFYPIFLVCVYIIFFGIQGETILESGYGKADVQKGTLHEYFIAFFVLLVLTANKLSFFERNIIFYLFIFYVFKTLLYGGRIEVVIIGLAYLYLFKNFLEGRQLMALLSAFLVYFVMDLIGHIRTNPELVLAILNLDFSNFFISSSLKPSIVSNQFGDVYQSSLRIVGLYDQNLIEPWVGLKSFFLVVIGFAPSSIMPDYYNLAAYLKNISTSGGGGLISAFSYVWLGYFGPVLFGLFIGYSIRMLYTSSNTLVVIYGFMVLIFFPRWFAYYPIVLFKISLFVLIIASVIFFIKKHYGRKKFV